MGAPQELNNPSMLKKQMLFIAAMMILGQCAFLFATSQMTQIGSFDPSALEVARVIAPVFALLMILFGSMLYRKNLAAAKAVSTLEEKIVKYRKAFLLRAVCIHLGGFLSVIAYFLTREDMFLAIAISMFAVQLIFALQSANEVQINAALELNA